MKAYEIPEATTNRKGNSCGQFPESDAAREDHCGDSVSGNSRSDKYLIAVTKKERSKRQRWRSLIPTGRSGLIAINLKDGDELIGIKQTSGTSNVIIVTKHGKCICFSEEDVRPMGRIAGRSEGDSSWKMGMKS